MVANPEKYPRIHYEIKHMSPLAAMQAMAKGQNRSLKQIVDRRMKLGAADKIKVIADNMRTGTKYDIPLLDYAPGGFNQDGYHRLLAAQELDIKSVPILVINRT